MIDSNQQLKLARQILQSEKDAISQIELDEDFLAAVDLVSWISDGGGSLVISGMGKSGLVGQKISATMASVGVPSHFLHPAEALHGDLGRVTHKDAVLLISFGGQTEEVLSLAAILKQDGVKRLAMVGPKDCDLAKLSDVTLSIGNIEEACPLNLAPTASTTAMMALGDALALCVSQNRAFTADDFARVHPGGSLGRQLTPLVDVMRFKVPETLELMHEKMTVQEALSRTHDKESSVRRTGAMLIGGSDGRLSGIFTDGDMRRLIMKSPDQTQEWLSKPITEVMTPNPRCLRWDQLVRDAVQMVRSHRIDEIPVVNENNEAVGLIDIQDLLALKVIR